MKRAVKGLDHVVVMVDGIDAAEAAYKKLGFQVQPRGFHRKLGTANHLMIFDTDYFEILGVVEDTEFNAERREWLKQGGGLANVALATDGADLAFDAFKQAGLQPDAPLFFDRAVEVAGKIEHAQFRTVRIPKTHMPVVGFFVCEHLTPQFVYRGEWAKHPNGARGILGVTVIAEQPAQWIPELEKYFGPGSVKREGEGLVVDTGTQPVRYLDRKGYTARYPGVAPVRPGDHPALLSLRVDSLAACEALLRQNGVTFVRPDAGRLIVPPDQAAHLTIEFVEGEPDFQHFAQRGDRHPAEESYTKHHRDETRSHPRVTLRVGEERKRRQAYQLLPCPESRAATGDLFEQIAHESLPGTGAADPSQEPESESRVSHVHPSWTGIPRHSTVSAFFAALTSRNPVVVIEK